MKITALQFQEFSRKYWINKNKSLRFGQAFYNKFNLKHSDFPTLEEDGKFYNTYNICWIENYIWTHFVEN